MTAVVVTVGSGIATGLGVGLPTAVVVTVGSGIATGLGVGLPTAVVVTVGSEIATGRGVTPPGAEGALSSSVPQDRPAATGTNGRADLPTPAAVATPTARFGTPVRVRTTAGGEGPVTGPDR
ncbi:hypothetical protein SAMN05421678_109309 [Actinopolymorpha cephalotaxi]|uniref:Uncharacterized protein n=1 Tax=Actinopolymorpha cephalotaxi TaxID=504797 RepID=A0A1I2VR65_9ACTN|nr:hypothetical protein [Actinopolymorpha cephalotaxi]NYH83198.1 hypothetical protein [Actinopolymorpha cephalotaxi]SFG91652.1 hypothetical protein SAMN05421678_109309 [Actinopolymorpha cephalotaxi]